MHALDLVLAYNKKGREYHNWLHVSKMFEYARQHGLNLTSAQRMAILYHDIVYVPGGAGNERGSAEVMWREEAPNFRGEPDILGDARSIIMDTADHLPSHPFSEDVIDLDLYELGTGLYRASVKRLRREFSHMLEDEWAGARAAWLVKFLNRDRIYVGFLDGGIFEKRARGNMDEEYFELMGKAYGEI